MIEPRHWIQEATPTIQLTSASHLASQPDAAFELACAPDGLPLVMHVRRAIDVRKPVLQALHADQKLTHDLERALADLERIARAYSVDKRIICAGMRASMRAYYESVNSVSGQFGATLLARMLGAVSPMVMPEDVAAARDPSRFENSALFSMADLAGRPREAGKTAPITFGRNANLWIGISRDTPNLAVAAGDSVEARLASGRPLIFESLLAVRSARWHVLERHTHRTHDGKISELAAYRKALQSAERLSWSISRVDATKLVAELARAVDRDWHARRRVHADLKPGNVLLEQSAIRAFDALDVAEGETSPGVTEGWAAPEQIFVRPVTPATDVFALALMAVSALSAAVFGEESAVVVPAAGEGRRRLRMMKNPEIWLDPKRVELPDEARVAWRDLLVRSLAFAPERRPQRARELADRMDELLDRWELPGRLEIACGPGHLEFFAGSREPAWILDDRS